PTAHRPSQTPEPTGPPSLGACRRRRRPADRHMVADDMASFGSTTSHIGLCIPDLERSRRFYVEGLGFTEFARFELDRPIAEVDSPCSLTSFFVEKDGLRVELLEFRSPSVFGTPSTCRNQLGLTHLSFVVDDVDSAAAELERYARRIVERTRSG